MGGSYFDLGQFHCLSTQGDYSLKNGPCDAPAGLLAFDRINQDSIAARIKERAALMTAFFSPSTRSSSPPLLQIMLDAWLLMKFTSAQIVASTAS